MTIEWHDAVGTIGAMMIVVTYFLLQINRLSSRSLSYSLLNGTGALLILVSLLVQYNFSAFLIEAFWLAISVFGVWQWRARQRQS